MFGRNGDGFFFTDPNAQVARQLISRQLWQDQEADDLHFRCKTITDGSADTVYFSTCAIDILVRLHRSRQRSLIGSPRPSNFQICKLVNL